MKAIYMLPLLLLLTGCGCISPSPTPSPSTVPHTITISSMDAWHQGVTAYQNGDTETAISYYTEAIHRDNGNFHAYADRGIAYALQQNYSQAKKDLDTALLITPHHPAVLYNLAMYYKLQGQLSEALSAFQQVLRTEHEHAWTLYGIATIYADLGNDEQALAYLRRACRADIHVCDVAATQDHFIRFHQSPEFRAIIEQNKQ